MVFGISVKPFTIGYSIAYFYLKKQAHKKGLLKIKTVQRVIGLIS
jgi:hypothetical protein